MNNPAGFGGILLLLAAVVWLVIFVPGYSSRSQLAARTNLVKRSQRAESKNLPLTPQQQLIRLTNTQRGFSILFALLLLAAIAAGFSALVDSSFWLVAGLAFLLATFSLFVSRAAARSAAEIAKSLRANRQRIRSTAARSVAQASNRDWTPNPIPAPLAKSTVPAEEPQLAQVIDISAPARTISSRELDEILARRRAI